MIPLIKQYRFNMPRSLLFGPGSADKLDEEIRQIGCDRVMLVIDKRIRHLPAIERIAQSLTEKGIDYVVYDGVDTEPTHVHLEEGTSLFRKNDRQMLVAVGGGSSIDASKGIGILVTHGGDIADWEGRDRLTKRIPPLIAIPTTAGTGSEISRVSVINDLRRKLKFIINSTFLCPELAIEDPLLTVSMPPSVTASSGMDALTHAIEGYISKRPPNLGFGVESLTDVTAREAIRLIAGNLRKAWANGEDLEARSNMMLGQLLAAMTFSNSGTALVHGLARPLGAYFHVPHGLANAIMLPYGMEFTLQACPEKFKDVAMAFGEFVDDLPAERAACVAIDCVRRLCQDIQIPRLGEVVNREDLEQVIETMARDGYESGTPKVNPRLPTIEQMVDLYRKAL
ncbi:MAG: iron-containing alcohol dehydrogenase [Deltaproteobacteria bacterium]|nr:iron-containing alcohol dehydrogenase [Deltaproteobacteria bacterium]